MTPRLVDYHARRSIIAEIAYDVTLSEGVASLTPARITEEAGWSPSSTRRALASGRPIPAFALDVIDRRFRFRINEPRPAFLVEGGRRSRADTPSWVRCLDQLLLDLPWTEERRDDAIVVARLVHGCSDQPWAHERAAEFRESRRRLATGAMAGASDLATEVATLAALAGGVTSTVADGALPLDEAVPVVREYTLGRRRDLGLPAHPPFAANDLAAIADLG